MLTATDMEGVTVKAGDRVAFTYGIPPVRVEGVLFERDGKLIMPTPDHNPPEATLPQINYHCGGFWKVGVTEEEWRAIRAAENAEFFDD